MTTSPFGILKPHPIAFAPSLLELLTVWPNHHHTELLCFTFVGIDAKSLVGDPEGSPVPGKPSDDSGHVGVSSLGAISGMNDSSSSVVSRSITVRRAVTRRRARRVIRLGRCGHSAENDEYQKDRGRQMESLGHDSLTGEVLPLIKQSCFGDLQ
jgi:hypothetical protein